MREALQEEPDTLLVVSSYHIGKERAYLGAAAALGLKVCGSSHGQMLLPTTVCRPAVLEVATA